MLCHVHTPGFFCTVACAAALGGCGVRLVDQGVSDYSIIIPDNAIPAEQSAANELALHLRQMSGAQLAIVGESAYDGDRAIVLGPCKRLDQLGVQYDPAALGKEGYLLRTVGDNLIIAGGRPRGTLYGVYHLLEKRLGCRWFAPDTSHIPRAKTIALPMLDEVGTPSFEYRDPWLYTGGVYSWWWRDHYSPQYMARTRNSGNQVNRHAHPVDDQFGGHFDIPFSGHNLNLLVPAAKYAEQHPEYYALWQGRRTVTSDLELCLSHPAVTKIAADTMLGWMRRRPDADMFHIGQSDTFRFCQCDRCQGEYRKHRSPNPPRGSGPSAAAAGGYAGLFVRFANAIAEHVESEFPDKPIRFFVYGTTLAPPRGVNLHKNLVIFFCPMQRDNAHAIDEGPFNKDFWDFKNPLARWRDISTSKKIYAYEYWVYGMNPPFYLPTIAPSVRTYYEMGVWGCLMDGIRDVQAGFGFMQYWLWSQILNDVNFDFSRGLNEFVTAYYGAAAPHIRAFLELSINPDAYELLSQDFASNHFPKGSALWHKARQISHMELRPFKSHAMERAYQLFEQALAAVRDDPKALRHVRAARMVLQWRMLEHLPADDPRLADEIDSLLATAKSLEMPTIHGDPLDVYRQKITDKISSASSE